MTETTAPARKERPRRWSYPWAQSLVGDRVVVTLVKRYAGREGVVVRTEWVQGGGAGNRMCLVVRLDAVGRAAERTIRCNISSVEPLE